MEKIKLKLTGLSGYYLEQSINENHLQKCGIEIKKTETDTSTRFEFYFVFDNVQDITKKLSYLLSTLLDH